MLVSVLPINFTQVMNVIRSRELRKDNKVFGLCRSMIIGETEKIRSVTPKHILIFVILLGGDGLFFKFEFMNIIHNMNKTKNPEKRVGEKTRYHEKTRSNGMFWFKE